MNAEASTRRTPRRRSKAQTAASNADSLGLWIKLTPNGVSPREDCRRSMAASTFSGGSPAEPKNESRPALAPASTNSTEAIPFAMAPVA